MGEDTDGDGVRILCDNCPFAANPTQLDTDRDGYGNACDNCPFEPNPDQADPDNDRRGTVCDNCPTTSNPFQDDFDGDRVGDACDNCPFDPNPSQSDTDNDNEGDARDLDDGLIWIYSTDRNYREWQAESGYTTCNSYRGSLAALRSTGAYTQSPGSNPLADRACGLTVPYVEDLTIPAVGDVAFHLTTGVAGGMESGLGKDSRGNPRPNANPCP